jgi:hypothetical protein
MHQPPGGLRLVAEAREQLRAAALLDELAAQQLDGHGAPKDRVGGLVDHAHGAFADHGVDRVLGQLRRMIHAAPILHRRNRFHRAAAPSSE